MDIGGRAKQDARAEEQLMTLPQNRETLAERSNLYTDWYKLKRLIWSIGNMRFTTIVLKSDYRDYPTYIF